MPFSFEPTATPQLYTLSLHDALPISSGNIVNNAALVFSRADNITVPNVISGTGDDIGHRSEEHTSELQSQSNLVCRLLLEKKKPTESCSSHSPLTFHRWRCAPES